jgi:hypothetical protein
MRSETSASRRGPVAATPTRIWSTNAATSSERCEEAALVVYGLRIFIGPGVAEAAAGELVKALNQRFRTWLRASGNERLRIPIIGPDGKTVLSVVEVDTPPEDDSA